MTVGELIAVLQSLPRDLPVFYNKERYFDYPAHITVSWMDDYTVVDPDEVEEGTELRQAVIIW